MNKYKYIMIMVLLCFGCQSVSWNKEETALFNNDCADAGQDVAVCQCLLQCLMQEYASYSFAVKNISSEKLSEELGGCVEGCK